MHRYTFDVKAWVTVHVQAATEADARALIEDRLPGYIEGLGQADGELFVNSSSLDGEHDLIEVDGEEPD